MPPPTSVRPAQPPAPARGPTGAAPAEATSRRRSHRRRVRRRGRVLQRRPGAGADRGGGAAVQRPRLLRLRPRLDLRARRAGAGPLRRAATADRPQGPRHPDFGIVLLGLAVSVMWGDWWSPLHGWLFPVGLMALARGCCSDPTPATTGFRRCLPPAGAPRLRPLGVELAVRVNRASATDADVIAPTAGLDQETGPAATTSATRQLRRLERRGRRHRWAGRRPDRHPPRSRCRCRSRRRDRGPHRPDHRPPTTEAGAGGRGWGAPPPPVAPWDVPPSPVPDDAVARGPSQTSPAQPSAPALPRPRRVRGAAHLDRRGLAHRSRAHYRPGGRPRDPRPGFRPRILRRWVSGVDLPGSGGGPRCS